MRAVLFAVCCLLSTGWEIAKFPAGCCCYGKYKSFMLQTRGAKLLLLVGEASMFAVCIRSSFGINKRLLN